MQKVRIRLVAAVTIILLVGIAGVLQAQFRVRDPGVRAGDKFAGGPLRGLTTEELAYFTAGLADFAEEEGVGDGLGPRFNLDSCGGCHIHPNLGGTSPAINPQVAAATASGARNRVPSFINLNGPVREARFQFNPDGTRDGGVHALFVISGRVDATGNATGCNAVQEDFEKQVANDNIIFRIPTPTFGLGLVEKITDHTILDNMAANSSTKRALGISGRANRNGNDGTITRFGWKAQNKSLTIFSGEAYNVEMGITNEAFQTERDENPTCQFATVPNDVPPTTGNTTDGISAITKFSFFMRFLAPPSPAAATDSINRGRQVFSNIGCALCHTPTLKTGSRATVAALRNQDVNLFSDLLLHQMGPGLADDIVQGGGGPDEFRTAPLWGVGQRIFFLHDGRTTDLLDAIRAHKSFGDRKFGPSEANGVVDNFSRLGDSDKQNVLNFLRSL